MVIENNEDIFVIKWTSEIESWLKENTPSYNILPPEPSQYDLERIRIKFNEQVDVIAYKLTWL